MMEIVKKLQAKQSDLRGAPAVTIAFLGDSVTQGCFECYMTSKTTLETVFDYKHAYSTAVGDILHTLYPSVQVNIVNSGISGDSAVGGAKRLERDVLSHRPDLVVLSFGLNDSTKGREGIGEYAAALEEMMIKLRAEGIEVIFLTQNFMCQKTSPHIMNEPLFVSLAERFAEIQKSGVLGEYFAAAREVAKKHGAVLCDLYAVWEAMAAAGVDVTELLSNKLNHPTREFHRYMAAKLVETMLLG